MRKIRLLAGLAAVAVFASGCQFYAPFNSGIPTSLSDSIYHRDDSLVAQSSWPGSHDLTCGPPTSSRTITRGTRTLADDGQFFNSDWRYFCDPSGTGANGHLMTAIGDTSGYSTGAVYTTATDVTRIEWDVNISHGAGIGGRQWTEVKLWPVANAEYDQYGELVIPCGTWVADTCASDTDGDGTIDDRNFGTYGAVGAIGLGLGGSPGVNVLGTRTQHWGAWNQWIDCGGLPTPCSQSGGVDPAWVSEMIRRKHFLQDNGNGTITHGIEKSDGTYFTMTVDGSFPEGAVYVAWADHNYTPNKSVEETGVPVTKYTWHWDNLAID